MLGKVVLATVMPTPALVLSYFDKPSGIADLGGLPTSDKTSDLWGHLDNDHKRGYDTFLDETSGVLSGFPDEEKPVT